MTPLHPRPRRGSLVVLALPLLLLGAANLPAQFRPDPGHSIGTVRTDGKLIVLTLDEGALGTANLFDLDHQTLRFTPQGSRYRVERLPLQWDGDFGAPMTSSDAALAHVRFPFWALAGAHSRSASRDRSPSVIPSPAFVAWRRRAPVTAGIAGAVSPSIALPSWRKRRPD